MDLIAHFTKPHPTNELHVAESEARSRSLWLHLLRQPLWAHTTLYVVYKLLCLANIFRRPNVERVVRVAQHVPLVGNYVGTWAKEWAHSVDQYWYFARAGNR